MEEGEEEGYQMDEGDDGDGLDEEENDEWSLVVFLGCENEEDERN